MIDKSLYIKSLKNRINQHIKNDILFIYIYTILMRFSANLVATTTLM